MYDLCVFTCIIFIFVFLCTYVRISYVLNSYLLTYLLTLNEQSFIWKLNVYVCAWLHYIETACFIDRKCE